MTYAIQGRTKTRMDSESNNIQIFSQNTQDCPYNAVEFLTIKDRERLKKIQRDSHRLAFMNAHSLLNYTLAEFLNISPTALNFSYNQDGKPFLNRKITEAMGKNIYFSLSHSKEQAVVAVAEDIELGIDIEQNRSRDLQSCKKLSERFYHAGEQEYIASATTENDQQNRFYQLWTLKEAYLKALGTGIKTTLNSLNFTIDKDRIELTAANTPVSDYSFYSTTIPKYSIALAYNNIQQFPLRIFYNSNEI